MSFRILHIYQKFSFEPNGGIEQGIKQYSFALHKYHQCQNTVLYLDLKPRLKKKDYLTAVSTMQIGKILSCSIPTLSFFQKFIELQKRHDVIIFHYPFPIQDLTLIFGLINKPYFIHYHSDVIIQKKVLFIYIPLRYLFFKFAKQIITGSENYLRSSIFLRNYKKKTKVITYILNEELITVKKKKIPYKYFLFIGQYRHYKNIDQIIQAFKQLPQHQLIMIGPKKVQLVNYDLSSNVSVIDNVSDEEKYNYIAQCKALILPSCNRAEAFGYSLLEGLHFKKPLISCEIKSGTSFINKHLKTGLVLKNANSTDIIKGINYFIANSKQFNITSNFKKQYSKFNPKTIALELFNALCTHHNINFAKNKFSKNFKSL
jgi:rhamnosyl/mannosyltransferase